MPETGHADAGGQVAVRDELDAGAGGADVGDQLLVARPVQDHDGDVPRPATQPLGDRPDGGLDGVVDRNVSDHLRSHDQLAHVGVRRVQQATRLCRSQHGRGVRAARGDQVRPLQRVDRDVDLHGRLRIADLLADVEHGRLVALALADDDGARDLRLFHRPPHRLHRGVVGGVAVAAAHQPGSGDGARLGGGNGLAGDQLVHLVHRPRAISAGSGVAR